MDSRRGDRDVDLESGGLVRENNESEIQEVRLLHRSWSGGLLGEPIVSHQDGLHSNEKATSADDISVKNSAEITEIHSTKLKDNKGTPRGKKSSKEKLKKPKPPSKPPRPPKGPSLDPADIKLVKEISEMTVRKHKRMERLRSLKKMKDRTPSSKTNIVAMGITILFFFIIIFHVTLPI
ncbi:PREDICTED: uncharacterized protein LOC109182390 isoform X2 [Ipomoea nil]|uniref:uncharacterized protein LOC109182390 isoform X2 n=1 Tax=Ipomoea nil TaxID=35883 RepID=UPI000900B497|nr:PREDICTED: uncharacterized protein LOC109182390 isoform X2 [Ipomoea nil]